MEKYKVLKGNELSGFFMRPDSIIGITYEPGQVGELKYDVHLIEGIVESRNSFIGRTVDIKPPFNFKCRTNRFEEYIKNGNAMLLTYDIFI